MLAVPVVKASSTTIDNHFSLALFSAAAELPSPALAAHWDGCVEIDTRPPPDLVVTLQRLII